MLQLQKIKYDFQITFFDMHYGFGTLEWDLGFLDICFIKLPSPSLLPFIVNELPASSCQDTTFTKSATKDGIEHLRIAEFPRITYSLLTSDSYCCCTTVKHFSLNIRKWIRRTEGNRS